MGGTGPAKRTQRRGDPRNTRGAVGRAVDTGIGSLLFVNKKKQKTLKLKISERPVLPLQIAIGLAGLVPVGAGLAGIWLGPAMLDPAIHTSAADSHFRYLSGLLLGIGFLFWSMIPKIANRGPAVRMLTLVVVTGGLARALGLALHDPLTPATAFALTMELGVTPLLCLWQAWIETSPRKS